MRGLNDVRTSEINPKDTEAGRDIEKMDEVKYRTRDRKVPSIYEHWESDYKKCLMNEIEEKDSERNVDTAAKYLELGEDGKYYDKEMNKKYDSIEEWESEMKALLEKYEKEIKENIEGFEKERELSKNADTSFERYQHEEKSNDYLFDAWICDSKIKALKERLGINEETQREDNGEESNENYLEKKEFSGRELLDIIESKEFLLINKMSPENRAAMENLIDKIKDSLTCYDEIEPTGQLLPEYAELMENRGYEDLDEMCNMEELDSSEIFDDEFKEYGDEFARGFCDEIDNPDWFSVDRDDCPNDAYYEGRCAAQELRELLN